MSAAPLSLSRPFILRPVATSLLMLAVLIAGLLAWRQLPVAALPQVDYPVIQVFTFQNPGIMACGKILCSQAIRLL